MKRTKGLQRKDGRLFPQDDADKAYWEWFKKQRSPCDVCGYFPASAAHLTKRGSGGRDRSNLCWLCEDHYHPKTGIYLTNDANNMIRGCHPKQEGRTDAFILECKKPLWDIAQRHTARFDREVLPLQHG